MEDVISSIRPETVSEKEHGIFVNDDGKIESEDIHTGDAPAKSSHIKTYSDNEAIIELTECHHNSISEASTQDGNTETYTVNTDSMDVEEETSSLTNENEANIDLTAFYVNTISEVLTQEGHSVNEAENKDSTCAGNGRENEANIDLTPSDVNSISQAQEQDSNILDRTKIFSDDIEAQLTEFQMDSISEVTTTCNENTNLMEVGSMDNEDEEISSDPKESQTLISVNIEEEKGKTDQVAQGDKETTGILIESVRVIWFDYKKEYADLRSNENAIVIYRKKFENIRVAAYDGHEYISMPYRLKDNTAWRCNKSKFCPVLLFIGKDGNSQIHLVSEHNCSDAIDILKNTELNKFKRVNVLYYELPDTSILDLNRDYLSSLGDSILILYDDNKSGENMVLYDGYNYVKSLVAKNFFEYGCPSIECDCTLRLSCGGIDNKMVLKIGSHSCQPKTSPIQPKQVPKGLMAVTPVNYKTHQELAFLLKLNQLQPCNGRPLIYVDERSIYYQNFEYCVPASSDIRLSLGTCKTKPCRAQLYVTSDFRAVSKATKHICVSRDITHSCFYNLLKVSKISLMEYADGNIQSGYIQVKYKHFRLKPTFDPNDKETVTIYFDVSIQRDLCHYKGYTYAYGAHLQILLCNKSSTCAGALVLCRESSEVMEIGEHSCNHVNSRIDKLEEPISFIDKSKEPIESNTKKPIDISKSGPTRTDKRYIPVKIRDCLKDGLRVAGLNPNDPSTAWLCRDEAGKPVICYRGCTYHYYSNSSLYFCSKSNKCPAVLKRRAIIRCELAEVGQHNCTSTTSVSNNSADDKFESRGIKFKVFPADDFSQIPGFDLNDRTIVTLLVGGIQPHNVVYYRGHMYIDDQSLSCGRGKRLTRQSCNLLYMCVKSNACSAGLSMSRDRKSALEVGLHNCISNPSITDQNKLFRELKLVKFCHRANGTSSDNLGIINLQTVETYFENRKKVVCYKGHTYMDRVTACSHGVGCKCIYICRKRSFCSAALLVNAHDAVLEVGMHSCISVENEETRNGTDNHTDGSLNKEETQTTPKVVYIMPKPLLNETEIASAHSSDFTEGKLPSNITSGETSTDVDSDTNLHIMHNKRKSNFSSNCPKPKMRIIDYSYTSVIIINHLENTLKEVPFEEQIQFSELDLTSLKFRGYIHTKGGTEGQYTIYNCIDTQFNRCSGLLLVRCRRVIWANNHSCQEIPRPDLLAQSNYLIIYYNENTLCPEALYKGFTYLRNKLGKKVVQWTCAKNGRCAGEIHILNGSLAKLGNHTCGNDQLTSAGNLSKVSEFILYNFNKVYSGADVERKPNQRRSKAERLFIETTRGWSTSLIPVMDEKGVLCVIYQGYIYSLKQVLLETNSLFASEWMCNQEKCDAVLLLVRAEVRATSKHSCFRGVPALLPRAIPVIPMDKRLPLQVFRGKRKFLAHEGYVYHAYKDNPLKCIYVETSGCRGTLRVRNNKPIAVSDHSCRTFSCSERLIEIDGTRVKEETEEFEESNAATTMPLKSECDEINVEDDSANKAEGCEEQMSLKSECDDITIKEEDVAQTYAEGTHSWQPDLIPFNTNEDYNGCEMPINAAKDCHILEEESLQIPVHKNDEGVVYYLLEFKPELTQTTNVELEDCSFITKDERSIKIEDVEPIAICDDQTQPEEDSLHVDDSESNIEYVECLPPAQCDDDETILEELLNVNYSGSEPLVAQNIPAATEDSQQKNSNSFDDFQDIEDFIPATVLTQRESQTYQ